MSITSRRVKITTAVASSVLTLGLVTSAAAPALAAPPSVSASYPTSVVHVVAAKTTKVTTVGKVAITGFAETNSKLTAHVSGSWKVGKKTIRPRLAYQWYQNGHAISGARSSTYTINPKYAKARISVNVTASLKGYTTTIIQSKTTSAVAAIAQSKGTFTAIAAVPKPGATTTTVTVSLKGFVKGSSVIVAVGSFKKVVKVATNGTATVTLIVTVSSKKGVPTIYTVTLSSSLTGYITYSPSKKSVTCGSGYVQPATSGNNH